MATRADVKRELITLSTMMNGPAITDDVVDAWTADLKSVPTDVAVKAFTQWRSTQEKFPSGTFKFLDVCRRIHREVHGQPQQIEYKPEDVWEGRVNQNDVPAAQRPCEARGCPLLGTITDSVVASKSARWQCRFHNTVADRSQWDEITRRLRIDMIEPVREPGQEG